jgi:hypothetical protein
MIATALPAPFTPLAQLLQAIDPTGLARARVKVAGFDREELIARFRASFSAAKRKLAWLCADQLIQRGIPPAFWHDYRSRTDYSVEQRFDLFAYDVRWLRFAYPDHARIVRYTRCKQMLTGPEKDFWREAEFAFYAGRRPAWKIVGSLSLTVNQQTDCWWLRSAPVSRRLQAVTAKREQVFTALSENLKYVRRTATFTDDDAVGLLLRRHQLWLCGQMSGGKPTETAQRFHQLTGQSISRQLAANHLQKVEAVLRKIEMTLQSESETT